MEISVATVCGAYMAGFSAGRGLENEGLGDLVIAKELISGEPSQVVLSTLTGLGTKMTEKKKSNDSAQ